MNPLKISVLLCSFLLFSCTHGGDEINQKINKLKEKHPVPELRQAEMYADFDALISIMERCNPQHLVRKKVTHYDLIAEMKAQRTQIENCSTTLDFIKLLKNVLSLSLDEHCTANASTVWLYRNSFYKKDVKINKITDRDFGINFHYIHDVFYQNPPKIHLVYIQNRYFLKNTTTFSNRTNTINIPAGTEIFTFNQQSIGDIQNSVRNKSSRWDFDKKKYNHLILDVIGSQNSVSFNINDTIQEYVFTEFLEIEDDDMKRIHEGKYQVKWLEKDSIVYITIPGMIYSKDWLQQLKSELLFCKEKPVQSIIIDIRGNEGGNDKVWHEVLGMIYKNPMEYPCFLIKNTDDEVIKRVQSSDKKLMPKKENQKRIFEYLDSQYAFQVDEEGMDIIENEKENLGYEGVIYLLVNEDIYSSALAFASFCTKTDRIKTVGMPTGKIGGQGISPSVFILPNSRLLFSMELLLDAAGVSKVEDFYHDHINYPVMPSINYYKYWYDPARSYAIDEKTMYEQDEVFKKALEVIKHESKSAL
jgi:hypothetical protein